MGLDGTYEMVLILKIRIEENGLTIMVCGQVMNPQ